MPRVVYGLHPVREALRARAAEFEVLYLSAAGRGPTLQALAEEAAGRGVKVDWRAPADLEALAPDRHQGAVAIVGPYPYAAPEALLAAAAARGQPPLILALDGVQDPRNLGALVRCADGLGAHGVIVPGDRAAPVTAAAVRASAGATEHLPVARVTNLVRALGALKEAGLWVVGTLPGADAPPPWEVDLTGPIAVVVGSEGKGVRPLVARACDLRARIPMQGRVESLNVAAAAAALLYEALRQRSAGRKGES